MDVNKPSLYSNLASLFVAGKGSKSSKVQRSSNPNPADTFVGRDDSGRVLAYVRNGAIPINQSPSSLADAFKTYAKNQNQILGLAA